MSFKHPARTGTLRKLHTQSSCYTKSGNCPHLSSPRKIILPLLPCSPHQEVGYSTGFDMRLPWKVGTFANQVERKIVEMFNIVLILNN